jgi:hypothetical protein
VKSWSADGADCRILQAMRTTAFHVVHIGSLSDPI